MENKALAKNLFIVLLIFISFNVFSQRKNCKNLEIDFSSYVGNKPLVLDSQFYSNTFNQEFNVTKFKFYIGKIRLLEINGSEFKIDSYYLIDEHNPLSKKIILPNVPCGNYVAVEFILGVDSLDNCSGAQSGVLDPINGMFWEWNSGYIFLKLEGYSNFSKSTNNLLEYHIGGYRKPYNNIRKIKLELKPILSNEESSNYKLAIKVNLFEILAQPNPVNFQVLSAVTDFNNSTLIADNYMDMFSISIIEDEK